MSEEIRTIEINGVKIDVDLRSAKQIYKLKVGDKCKLLEKSDYGDPSVYSGVVAGFDMFPTKPTIIIAYVKNDYSSSDLCFAYINDGSKKWEVIPSIDNDLPLDKALVNEKFDKQIAKLSEEIESINLKRDWFNSNFGKYFETEATVAA